ATGFVGACLAVPFLDGRAGCLTAAFTDAFIAVLRGVGLTGRRDGLDADRWRAFTSSSFAMDSYPETPRRRARVTRSFFVRSAKDGGLLIGLDSPGTANAVTVGRLLGRPCVIRLRNSFPGADLTGL